jgi:hypothetical protein
MASTALSQQAVKGLDLGTSRIVLASMTGQSVNFTPQLNAFVDIPFSKMTEQMLARENILHEVEGAHIYAYGNRSDEFAKFLDGDTRRPMQSGLLNPAEPKNLQMIELLLERLCGKASDGEKLCLSIPSAPTDRGADLMFHERSVQGIFEKLGYQVQSVNEGLAVVYAELKDANFTGIGMSFGGGMCNICLAYLGLPVLTGRDDTGRRLHRSERCVGDRRDADDGAPAQGERRRKRLHHRQRGGRLDRPCPVRLLRRRHRDRGDRAADRNGRIEEAAALYDAHPDRVRRWDNNGGQLPHQAQNGDHRDRVAGQDQRGLSRQGSVERHRQGRAGRRDAQYVGAGSTGRIARHCSMETKGCASACDPA